MDAIPPIDYWSNRDRCERIFTFDRRRAPVVDGYKLNKLTVEWENNVNFGSSEHLKAGFRRNQGWKSLLVTLESVPEPLSEQTTRNLVWFADSPEKLETQVTSMPPWVRELVDKALASIPLDHTDPA